MYPNNFKLKKSPNWIIYFDKNSNNIVCNKKINIKLESQYYLIPINLIYEENIDNKYKISKNDYKKLCFGENWEKIQESLKLEITSYSFCKDNNNNIFLSSYMDNDYIYKFDYKNNQMERFEFAIPSAGGICGLYFQEPDYLWISLAVEHTIIKYSLTTKKNVFQVGEMDMDKK
jgi:hypothetical protein